MICSFVLRFFHDPPCNTLDEFRRKKRGDNLQRFETKVHAAKVVFENWMPKSWSWERQLYSHEFGVIVENLFQKLLIMFNSKVSRAIPHS